MYTLDYKKYAQTARELSAQSCVLLKNDNALPIKEKETVSIFGRTQIDTYYCGTGSGGMVNLPYLVNIVEGFSQKRKINQELLALHKEFIQENPFDKGQGWAMEPFSQKEMSLSTEIVEKARKKSDLAIFVIGRSAGEDKDVSATQGSYYLSQTEKENLKIVCKYFERTVVLLNVGGIMDMSFQKECNPSAIMYAWHGGCESGNAYADVLCGEENPSGSLSDTIAKKIEDYPSTENFGDPNENIYKEDIFVGYRYFETFAKEKVMYPFGFGLSYTDFAIEKATFTNNTVKVTVKNIGKVSGKKTVFAFMQAPNGKLGKAEKVLVAFEKTKTLNPQEAQELSMEIEENTYSSFDEKTSCFILEKGMYKIHVGFDVRNTKIISNFILNSDKIISKCKEALAPTTSFEKICAIEENGERKISYKNALTRTYDIGDRIAKARGKAQEKTNFGYTFEDVKSGKITVKEFVNELTNLDLIHLTRGEGMCSPKVTAGTAAAFGGVSERLQELKIPVACCSDGPSGVRMDNGTMAYSLPNGTAIACAYNLELTEKIFDFLGLELVKNKVDTLLGSGMNIHRNPLCGRNFEYYSEDPYLTGKMTIAQLKSFHKYNVTGTIKHFACNNQELNRRDANTQISTRALREIYLKAFEMAVKESNAFLIMTAYNPINHIQSASNFDLTTTILREDWGFKGTVMTDWWATMNKEGETATAENTCQMILAQNDIYMVNADAKSNSNKDNSEIALKNGSLSRFELLRTGENIIETLLKLTCSKEKQIVKVINEPKNTRMDINDLGNFDLSKNIPCKKLITKKGTVNKFILSVKEKGNYRMILDLSANGNSLAQVPMTITFNGFESHTITLKGGTKEVKNIDFGVFTSIDTYTDIFFGESGMEVNSIKITLTQ